MAPLPVDLSSSADSNILTNLNLPKDFCDHVQALTMANNKKHNKGEVFPMQYLGVCNHSFRLSDHPWMVYSEEVDSVFCDAYANFCSNQSRRTLRVKQEK